MLHKDISRIYQGCNYEKLSGPVGLNADICITVSSKGSRGDRGSRWGNGLTQLFR